MFKIALCDDSEVILDNISSIIDNYLRGNYQTFEIDKFVDGNLLLAKHKDVNYDIIFLDIDMPSISGFDIAKQLRESNDNCYIIFITSHSELVYESFDFQPFNFIRKTGAEPVEKVLIKVLNQLLRHLKQNELIIFDDNTKGKISVEVKDIMYIESDKHYIKYYVNNVDNEIKVRETMKNCEEKYLNLDFMKIHKKYLVNMRYIISIDNNYDEVRIENGKRLPMSRNYKKSVDNLYTHYLRSKV